MNCLKDYIGIRGYGPAPLSGMFINQLPGITLESIDKTSEKEQVNFVGLWNDVQDRAWLRLQKDFRAALRNRYALSGIQSFARLNTVTDVAQIVLPAAKYRGVVIDHGYDAYRSLYHRHSKNTFLSTRVESVDVHLVEAGNVTLRIFDSYGTELDSRTAAGTVGVNRIDFGKVYPAHKLFVAVDASTTKLYKADLREEDKHGCLCGLVDVCENCKPSVFAAESNLTTPGVYTKVTDFFAIGVTYGSACNYSSLICSNREEFMDIWMYLLAAELMLERLYTARMNAYTTINKDSASELRDHFSVEYEKAMKETVLGLQVNNDGCIECSPMVGVRESLP